MKNAFLGLTPNSFFGALRTKLLLLRHTGGHYGGCWGVYGRWTGLAGHFFMGRTILIFCRRHGHASATGDRAPGLAWAGSERHRRRSRRSPARPDPVCLPRVRRGAWRFVVARDVAFDASQQMRIRIEFRHFFFFLI